MNGHGNYKSHLSVFGKADSFPGSGSTNKLSWHFDSNEKKRVREKWGMVWKLSYDLELSVPSVLASCTEFYSHSSGTAEPGTQRPGKAWMVPSHLLPDGGLYTNGGKALPEMTVFNLAGMVSSSWPSCLLSGCGHWIQAPIYVIILFNREGRALSCCWLPHSLAVRSGHAIYLSGSVGSSSHVHLKTFTKYLADVSRKQFHLLCREPGNQSPESILS